MKNLIRRALHRLGLEVYRPGTRRVSMRDALIHLRDTGFDPRTVIDVGVGYGTPALYEQFPGAHFLLIEPLREFEGRLREICRRLDGEYRIAAAGAEDGREVTLNVHPDLTSSSTLKEIEGSHVDGVPRSVPTVRLDTVCLETGRRGPYLLKVDVQGAELGVVDGAERILDSVEAIILEVSLFGFFEGGPELFDVTTFMKGKGYVVYDIFGGHHRPLDNALAQIDLVFVKENGRFRRTHAYAGSGQRPATRSGAGH